MSRFAAVCLTFLVSLLATSVAQAERIKDLAAIAGILLSADEAEEQSGQPAKRVRLVKRFMPGR